jgi:hypothetical protein
MYDDVGTGSEFSTGSNDLWEPQRLLSLDGDGPQGLFSLYVVEALMKIVAAMEKQRSPPAYSSTSSPLFRPVSAEKDASKPKLGPQTTTETVHQFFRPCHYFDFISGSSTGGLIATMLGSMRFTIDEAIDRGERTFVGLESQRRRKNSRRLEQNLQDCLEENYMSESDNSQAKGTFLLSASAQQYSQRGILGGDEHGCQT